MGSCVLVSPLRGSSLFYAYPGLPAGANSFRAYGAGISKMLPFSTTFAAHVKILAAQRQNSRAQQPTFCSPGLKPVILNALDAALKGRSSTDLPTAKRTENSRVGIASAVAFQIR